MCKYCRTPCYDNYQFPISQTSQPANISSSANYYNLVCKTVQPLHATSSCNGQGHVIGNWYQTQSIKIEIKTERCQLLYYNENVLHNYTGNNNFKKAVIFNTTYTYHQQQSKLNNKTTRVITFGNKTHLTAFTPKNGVLVRH